MLEQTEEEWQVHVLYPNHPRRDTHITSYYLLDRLKQDIKGLVTLYKKEGATDVWVVYKKTITQTKVLYYPEATL